MKKLPLGISDFRKVIRDNNYFVDKSLLIRDLVNSNAQVSLIPRPRRFGKTLNLSMLKYFFESGEDNAYLFKDLAISNTEVFDEHINKYPVIFLSFKDVKNDNFEEAQNKIFHIIRREFSRHSEDISTIINGADEESRYNYYKILQRKAGKETYEISLELLSRMLYIKYNREVVILIDEYDTPVHAAYLNGYYEKLIGFMRNFFSGAFKDNPYLFKGVITGILRVSRESIFSGLNNLATYTILDERYSTMFGFTIEETKEILADYGLQSKYDEVSETYNGYQFGSSTIFNPWSIINYIDNPRHEPLPYWANTSSNELVKHLIKVSSLSFKKNLEIWLKGGTIRSEIDSNIVFTEIENSDKNIYSLLFFSGYLKCVKKELIEETYYCDLAIPNREVRYIFKNIITQWINEGFRHDRLNLLLHSLVKGDIEMFEKLFSEFVIETLSYYDINKKNEEAVYQAFLLGMLVSLTDYEVISNREAGYGRVDIVLLHKKDKTKPAIIMELKTIDNFRGETREKALEKALRQIEEKQYETIARKRGFKNIIKMAVVFDGKRVWVKKA